MTDQSYPPPPPPPPGPSSSPQSPGPAWNSPAQTWQQPGQQDPGYQGGGYQGAGYPGGAYPNVPGQGPWGPLAGWGSRVGAMLIDTLVQLIGMVPYLVGAVMFAAGAPDTSSRYDSTTGTVTDVTTRDGNVGLMVAGGLLVLLGFLGMLGIQIWNRSFKQGRTGQSVGKKALGLKLVDERTGQPIGAGMAFVRDLAHVLDGFFYIGYLWPLWDDKRQTFADKILNTVVVQVPKG
ncbi:RDD family protein [Pedococcus ginsenosidimutans]|uniref:RDD family protein n=1 Tax=Pedococcus ginsenosidimutans TaxID=490570 RepID=A0ABP8XUF7_9MICO